MRRLFSLLSAILVIGLGAWPSIGAAAGQEQGPRPGDRVEHQGVAVRVPPPGRGVWAEAILADGSMRQLRVETTASGAVSVFTGDTGVSHHSEARTAPSGSPPACQDNEYNLEGWEWFETFDWYFNSGSTPNEISVDNAESAVLEGTRNMPQANNDCGLGDNVSATQLYQGRLNQSVQINSNSTCQQQGNGTSVIGFGDLLSNHVGYACVWYILVSGEAVESDVRLNKEEHQWVVNIGPNCTNKYSVEAVTTHERGHTFGIAHVSEADHGNLTMSTNINGPCQHSERTLGLGDVLGMEALY